MDQDQIQDHYLQKLYSIAERHFGDINIAAFGCSARGLDLTLPDTNRNYQSSTYYFQTPCSLVHWTSIQNLFSILNERALRLYNLESSDDANEISYAGELLGLNRNLLNFGKRHFFSISFCNGSEKDNPFMWKKYGKKYSKVAIEFEITNEALHWNNYHLSPVYYKVPDRFRLFLVEIEKTIINDGFSFYADLNKLLGFHKRGRFNPEKEIRLATYDPHNDIELYLRSSKPEPKIKKGRNRITRYINLPLWVDNKSTNVHTFSQLYDTQSPFDEDFFADKPKIKFRNIYFGENCGLSKVELRQFQSQINRVLKYQYGYQIKMEEKFVEACGQTFLEKGI